jgi:hypothetical protein
MKSSRSKQLFFFVAVLLLAGLACSQVGMPPAVATTEQQPTPGSVTVSSPEPAQTPMPTLGEVVFEDKFADNSNNWYVGKDKDTESIVEDGKYKVRILVPNNNFYWFASPLSVSDVDMTLDAEFAGGAPENAAYGLLCHYQDDGNYYRFRIAPDGSYTIDKSVNKETSVLADWTKSNAIKQGVGETNQVHVICNANHLVLYINDNFVADVMDTSLSGGSFQLMVGAYTNNKDDKNSIEVNFSNLTVRKPLAWERPTNTILSDSFDNNNNKWDVFQETDGSGQIENGQMIMKVNAEDSIYRIWTGTTLSNVDLTFDATIQEGDPANVAFGAACRYTNNDNYYSFNMDGKGFYILTKKVNKNPATLVDWTSSPAIKTGVGETNRIRVVCSHNILELYANDQLLVSSMDTSLLAGGFALQAGRFKKDGKPMSVGFDNVEVKYPEK